MRNHCHPFHHPQYSDITDPTNPRMMRKNSSINLLLDSTSSVVRNATANISYLIGSARRASYAGDLDPSVQMSGNCGSLYLQSSQPSPTVSPRLNRAFHREQTLSNEDQKHRRSITIYDGKIPSPRSNSPSMIPFDLITPIEAIENTNDPVDSYVQIVLETPDDRKQPNIFLYDSASSSESPSSENIYCYNNSTEQFVKPKRRLSFTKQSPSPTSMTTENDDNLKIKDNQNPLDLSNTYCSPPTVVEPMDFSFLDPILKGESAAPPPSCRRTRFLSHDNSNTTIYSPFDIDNMNKHRLNSISSSISINSDTSLESSSCLSSPIEKILPQHTLFESTTKVVNRKKNSDSMFISNMKHTNNAAVTLQVPL
ncbi:unnamed protein product [Didymodactylos carnosus]|uniref:Uncharacterized protein n=1 Tax=Didymodactylos carnosus TaxID=1234261 RepID=A0A814IR96_9BILA|nr:unnamed protein product [Didymodactylos carnosus]CAF3797271.1 unnamed protein product [Didymodactylos carnosus]